MAAKISPKDALIRANASYNAFGETATMLANDPRLTTDERQVLLHAHGVALKRRLRDEHPVLARFVDFIEGRGKPLATRDDWQTLVTLIGPDLSEAEKDAIDLLAKKELFTPEIRDEYFADYRETQRTARIGMIKNVGVKTGTARVSTIVANMAVAVGTSLIFPPALLAVIPISIIAHRKIDNAIVQGKERTMGSYGVNRLAGEEVDDERRLVLSHLAQFTGLDATTTKSLVESAQADVALVENLQSARGQAPPNDSPESKRLDAAVGGYAKALDGILAEHKKKPMTTEALRQALFSARAEALAPDVVRAAVVTTVAANSCTVWPELEIAFADVQQQALGVAEAALAPGGLSTPDKRQSLEADAIAFLKTIETMRSKAPDLVNPELHAFFADAYKNPTTVLNADAAKNLRDRWADVTDNVNGTMKDLEAKLKPISRDEAEAVASEVASSVVSQILPRYVKGDGSGTAKVTSAEPLEGGGYHVEATFKQGFSSSGRFAIDVAKDGLPDARSIQIEVGDSRLRSVAESAALAYERLFSDGKPDVSVGAIRNPSRENTDPFQLSGALADGAQRFKLTVSREGIPDLRSFAVT